MNKNKSNMSETMELDAILEEVRRSHSQTIDSEKSFEQRYVNQIPQSSNRKPVNTSVKECGPATQEEFVDISNGFVINNDVKKGKKNKKGKKSKMALAVIAAVFVFIAGAGFCAYTFLGNFTYARNVYVNDVCIGGMTEKEAQERLAQEEEKLLNDFNVKVTSADNETTLTKDDITFCTFDTDKVLRQARRYSKDNMFSSEKQEYHISMSVNDETLKAVSQKVETDLKQSAVDAKVTQFDSSKSGIDRFSFEDEKIGVEINKDGFEKQFASFLSSGKVSGEIPAESKNTEPKYTKEYLQNNIKELYSYSTTATSSASENSRENMKLAASMCNNSIINPGEIWSFNNCTGDSNLESNGYKVAGVLVNGQSAMGVGGGICQTSSTIYNAALYCGLHVQERRPHAVPSAYVPIGLDATIDYGNIDLKLKNTFDYQLFMECYMEDATVVCKIYGLENPDFDKVEVTSSSTSATTAVASRTFYKNGVRVTGENLPDEDLPPSNYDSTGGSSYSGSSDEAQTPSQDEPTSAPETTPSLTPEPEPMPEPEPDPQPTPEPDYDDTEFYY